jgi:hypothetical protein
MDYLLRNIDNNEYLTYFILASFILVMYIKQLYRYQFEELLNLPAYGKYFILYNKTDKKKNLFNLFFFIFFTINVSIYTSISFTSLEFLPKNDLNYFLAIFLLTNSYFVIKHLIEKLIFNIFDLNNLFDNYNFQKLTCINFISLLFFLTNLFFLYVETNPSNFLVYLSIGLFFLAYLISIIIIVLYNQKKFLKHWFYFILYLCALEIAPFIIGAVLIKYNLLNNL